jgi:hypothetical protein
MCGICNIMFLAYGVVTMTQIDPYIIAGVVIVMMGGMCYILVKNIYRHRTQEPNVDQFIDSIIPKMK